MFVGPHYPPLAPEDWQPSQGDLYKQFVKEFSVQGDFIAWIYHDSDWLLYADMSTIDLTPTWNNLPADDGDVYWSGPTKWVMTAGAWVVATQDIKPPPPPNPITGPEAPDFPTEPEDGDTHTDQAGRQWWYYDGAWHTKPQGQTGDIFTFDVKTDQSEATDLIDTLRVIPDLDLDTLSHQKDVNWALANAIEALDTQVDTNTDRLNELTMLIPGSEYLYELPNTILRPPVEGSYYILDQSGNYANTFGDAVILFIHHIDNTGTEHTLENLQLGDSIIIEHEFDAQNFGRYQVTSVDHAPDNSTLGLEVVSHKGSAEISQAYSVLAFPDINLSDKPSYDYVDDGLALKVDRSGPNTIGMPWTLELDPEHVFAKIAQDKLSLKYLNNPTDLTDATTKQYVDDLVADNAATPGEQGYTGSQGEIGYTGSQGIQGTEGPRGYTGSEGAQGDQGDTGFVGSQGEIGYTGSEGVFGFTGSQGDAGYTGSTGTQGIAGFTGSQGAQGDRGLTGSQGQQGGQGYTGSQGGLGDQGYDGSKGDPGARGFSGSQGAPGSDATVNPTDYVQRNIGGDDMQGPFNVKGHSGDSRSTSRIQALGLFSGSSNSALRLGTTGDRVYIDSENTQFNGGIMVNNIGPKTQDGRGVTLNIEGTNDKHLVTKSYVDSKLADGGGGGDYVSTVDGEQSMLGPLEIHSLGGWKASRVKLQYVTTKSDNEALQLGTPSSEDTLRVYQDKVKIKGPYPLEVREIKGTASTLGTTYTGPYTDDDHIATKKDVEAHMGGGGSIDTSNLVQKSGDTMTGTLVAPRIDVKQSTGEAVLLIEGNLSNNNSASRITMSNKVNANAYGSIEWHGQNTSGWFKFTRDVDLDTHGLHSVSRLKLLGDKAIMEGNTTRIKLSNKVEIPRVGDAKDGFTITGRNSTGNNGKLLYTYHNSGGNYDAVNYSGKQTSGSDNLATCKYVDDKVGSGGGSGFTPGDQVAKTDGEATEVGGFWIESGSLYVRVQ